MNKKRMIVDILMLLVLVLLYNLSFTGILVHEILGLVIWGLFIVHLIFNLKWIKQITKNILNKKLKKKTKFLYIIDVIIFIAFIVVTITGIMISKYIFSFNASVFELHKLSSIVAAVFIIIHLIMHTEFFIKQFTKMLNSEDRKKGVFLTVLMILISTILFLNGLFIDKIRNKLASEDASNMEEGKTEDNTDNIIVEENNPNLEEAEEEEDPTLAEYLSKMFCTGCGRRCPLTNPRCGEGVSQAKDAEIVYNDIYGEKD